MTQMQQPDEAPDTVALARVVVRDADAGHVLYEAMDTLDGVEGAAGRAVVEHEMAVPAGSVATTLALFVFAYGIVFSMGIYYINRLIARGRCRR